MSPWSDFRARLKRDNLRLIARELLDIDSPYVFTDKPAEYSQLQQYLRSELALSNSDRVCIIGSALTGFSLDPDAPGRAFNEMSDVDVVVVSTDTFDRLTSLLLDWTYPWHTRTWSASLRKWGIQLLENAFAGHLDPYHLRPTTLNGQLSIPGTRPFLGKWFNALQSTDQFSTLLTRQLNGRIYRSDEHLTRYLIRSLQLVRHSTQ